MLHHIPVPGLHAARIIPVGQDDRLIRFCPDFLIRPAVLAVPARRLVAAGKGQVQKEIRMLFPGLQDGAGRQRVKTEGAAAEKTAVPVCVRFFDRAQQPGEQSIVQRGRNPPVSGKARCLHESIFSTARNASLGTWTVPNWRMRFFPSFCFSRSFFFRVMSPP